MNFVDMILFHARTIPEQPAIVLYERMITYRQVEQGILSAERRLSEMGVKPGDLVAIEVDNAIVHLVLICALNRCGVASLSLGSATDGPLDALGITLLLKDRQGGTAVPARVGFIDDGWFNGPPMASGGGIGFTDPNATCRVTLSSGTTGRPKPLLFSAAVVEARLVTGALSNAALSWKRMLCLPGLSTYFGYLFATLALQQGQMVCFTPAAADKALDVIRLHRVDFLAATPNQLQLLMEVRGQRQMPCDSLRAVHVAGSLLTSAFLNQVRAELCNTVICVYGSTEVGPVTVGAVERLPRVDGAVGPIAPWAQVEILDADGALCARGQEGIVRMRTEGQVGRYDPAIASEATSNIRDGWFYSGDLAKMTEDGILIITGRSSQVINAGGVKLAPELIEDLLQAHPDIADAGAVGMVGGSGVEEIWVAVVVRRPIAAADIIAYCSQRNPKMAPKQVRFVAAIPRNAMGKIVRESLKQLLSA